MASLPSLPVEIMRDIVHLAVEANAESACQYATVSREWQYYIEEKTFSSLRVSSTNIQKLRHYVTPVRQSYVRELIFEVMIPEHDACDVNMLNRKRETLEDQDRNSRCFTDAIFRLFDTVASWHPPLGSMLGQHQGVCLRISASSPIVSPLDLDHGVGHWHKRWERSVLEIMQDGSRKLPILNAVTAFICGDIERSSRKIAPKACCDMAAQMLNLQKLEWYLSDHEDLNLDRRIEMGEDLISGLQRLPDSVRHFGLSFVGDRFEASNWWVAPRPFGGDKQRPDRLGVALRGLLQHLVTFHLVATVSPEVFWPVASLWTSLGFNDANSMSFPYLEKVSVLLPDVTPAGECPFTGRLQPSEIDSSLSRRSDLNNNDHDDNPYIDTSDNRRFSKDRLRQKLVEAYLLAAGHSAQHMPKLKEFQILWPFGMESFGLEYYLSEKEDFRAVLGLSDAPLPEPSPEVVKVWRQVTENLFGDPMLMDIELRDTSGEWPLFR